MSDAAVGSISHILKTAFKEVYEEPSKRAKAQAARIRKSEEAAASEAAVETSDAPDGTAPIEDAAIEETKAALSTPSTEEIYLAPLEKLNVADNLKSYLQDQQSSIDQELVETTDMAGALAKYLRERKEEAYHLEEIEEEELKKQGVMIGQHIPSLPSKLDIDQDHLQNFGNYSNNLVVARVLVEQNKQNTLRRTGNLPLSDLAEQINSQRTKKAATGEANIPHYLYQTGNATVRKERIEVRFAAITRAREVAEEEKAAKLAQSGVPFPEQRKRFSKQKGVLTGAQRLANDEILKGMNHKLNYLRNPRNIPQAINRLLVKSETGIIAQVPATLAQNSHALSEQPSQASAAPSSHSHTSGATSKRAKFGEMPLVTMPLFAADPPSLAYTEYEAGLKYELPIAFRNISAVSRMVRVLPPSTSAFSLSELTYPPKSQSGICAAGTRITGVVSFFPKSLGDYEDSLEIETEGGSFTVPIVARREAPKLSLPSVIDIGACLVGDAMRVSVRCVNAGGKGSFRLVSAEDYHAQAYSEYDWESMGCARMKPFTVYPVEFSLARGESIDLNIEYLPLAPGDCSQGLYLLCDNTQVFSYTLRACAKVLNLAVVEVNSVAFDSTNLEIRRDLFFAAANIGIEQSQQIVVVNDTGIPVEFEWVIVDAATRDKDLHKAGQNRIKEREYNARRLGSAPLPPPSGGGNAVALNNPSQSKPPNTAVRNGFEAPLSAPGSPMSTQLPLDTWIDTIADTQHEPPSNSVKEKEFEISPARGMMPSDGAEPFIFSFTPTGLGLATQKAVLMVRGVPMAALPGPSQEALLSRLQYQGHGEFVRLLSWLDEMGSTGKVDKYYKPNGMSATTIQLNNLQSLMGLALGHANGLVDPEDIQRIDSIVRLVVQHVESWMLDELVQDDAADNENIEDSNVYLKLYKWNGEPRKEPEVVPVLNLTKALAKDQQAKRAGAGAMPGVENEQEDAAWEEKGEQTEALEINADGAMRFKPFSIAEKSRMSEIYLDPAAILIVLGLGISDVLDDKVKHEAVDFVRECVHVHVACLSINASGEGKPQVINISPPLLRAPESLPIGAAWSGRFTLSNPSSAMAEIEICADQFKVFGVLPAAPNGGVLPPPPPDRIQTRPRSSSRERGFTFDEEEISGCNVSDAYSTLEPLYLPAFDTSRFLVEFDPCRVLLLPESESTIDVRVTALQCGEYSLVVPCRATTSDARVDSLTISLACNGPRLRFELPEVDLGLIGVRSEVTSTFTIRNDAAVPAVFSFSTDVLPDPEQEKFEKELGLMSSTPMAGKGAASARGPMSSARSDSDISVTPAAVVTVNPPTGTIGAGESLTATLTCKSGQLPQRLRGSLECRVFDESGSVEQQTQYQSFRGEIQAPKTIMYPMNIDLGVVYVGMPITFQVTTENICNLPTSYKLSRPGGDSPSFSIVFDKPTGPLGAKEKITILGTFTALLPGKIDDVMANKIFGVLSPLGFVVKALAKALQVDFPLLPADSEAPLPLAPAHFTQFHDAAAPPDPVPIEPLDFTHSVPLYERKLLRFAIRNLSAIPASFELKVKKFVVADKISSSCLFAVQIANEAASGNRDQAKSGARAAESKGTIRKSSRFMVNAESDIPILKAKEDGVYKFHSVDGKKYTGAAVERMENRRFLTSGLGASYLVEPSVGLLPPWGVKEITVRTFNDMPAVYDDEIEVVLVDTNSSSKRALIPLRMKVEGCPLSIENNAIGMTTVPRDKSIPLQIWQRSNPDKLLQLGVACVHAEPLVREFDVRNNGSMAAKVAWKVRSLTTKVNGPIKLELRLGGDRMRMKTSLLFWSDVARETPFRVSPESSTIQPYSTVSFKVAMFKTDAQGQEDAQLVGNVFLDPNGSTGLAMNPSGQSLVTADLGSTSQVISVDTPSITSTLLPAESTMPASYRLNLQLQGTLIAPSLVIDKKVLQANPTGAVTMPETMGLKFKTEATHLFSRNKGSTSGSGKKPAAVSKGISLVNPTDAMMVVSVSTQGPFILAQGGDDSLVPSHQSSSLGQPSSSMMMSQTMSGMGKMKTAFGSDTLGRTVTLMPKASASFTLTFNPTRSLRETLSQTQKPQAGPVPDEKGLLVMAFSTGQRINLPLSAQIASPFLVGSAPTMFFGVVSVGFQSDGILLLSNPTAVPARWTVAAVPGAGRSTRPSAIKVPGFQVPEEEMDDPTVFLITPAAGEVQGPTVSVVAATSALPRDYNRSGDIEPVVPQRLSETSWSTSTLSFKDTITKRHVEQHKTASDACYPQPIKVYFAPSKSGKYSSRFRFTCEYGNSFDVLLHGSGTFEEHLHAPMHPSPE